MSVKPLGNPLPSGPVGQRMIGFIVQHVRAPAGCTVSFNRSAYEEEAADTLPEALTRAQELIAQGMSQVKVLALVDVLLFEGP